MIIVKDNTNLWYYYDGSFWPVIIIAAASLCCFPSSSSKLSGVLVKRESPAAQSLGGSESLHRPSEQVSSFSQIKVVDIGGFLSLSYVTGGWE